MPRDTRPPVRLTNQERANAAIQLRAVLAAIYAGEVEVTDVQGAYLAGALDGLEGRLGRHGDTPAVQKSGV